MLTRLFPALLWFAFVSPLFGQVKVLSELDFSKDATPLGWSFDAAKTKVDGGKLWIQSPEGAGLEWASGEIQYGGSVGLEDATVRLEVDVTHITAYRDLTLGFFPAASHRYIEPAVLIRLNSSNDAGEILAEQNRDGGVHPIGKPTRVPFSLHGPIKVVLVLSNGTGKLEVRSGQRTFTFSLGKVIAPKWLVYPFTFQVGAMQHGNASGPAEVAISRVKLTSTNPKEAAVAEFIGNGPGKDERVTYIDLSPYANRCFEDETAEDGAGGWTDQGVNDLRFIPKGYQFFRNVPFYISDRLAIVGNKPEPGCLILKSVNFPHAPIESKPIEVNTGAGFLYFLQAASYAEMGMHCADYVVMYADGSTVEIPVRVGVETNEWWEPKDGVKAVVAWRGKNSVKDDVGFLLYEWANPQPEKKIRSVLFRSKNTLTTPMLIGLTASREKIAIGKYPRVFRDQTAEVCEYRQRIKTSYTFEKGPQEVAVNRTLPIGDDSKVRQARIDIIRYRADQPAKLTCTVGPETQEVTLKSGQLRGQFLFTMPAVMEYLTKNKKNFAIAVKLDDPQGVGVYRYETNPNHNFSPTGEDFAHGMYAVSGVFMVTPFAPEHRVSGYIEYLDKPVTAKPAEVAETVMRPAGGSIDWLGSKICLSSRWQWQPGGPKGFEGTETNIPATGWKNIYVPCDVGADIFAADQNFISAWFKKDLAIPAEWKDQRIVLNFMGVSEFATVFCNGKKLFYHEGLNAFDVDLTPAVKFGQSNRVVVFCANVYKGIRLQKCSEAMKMLIPLVAPYKGHAYRMDYTRGAWDQKPDEIELLLDGKNVAKKAGSIEEVVAGGNGLYYREQYWNKSTLYFSTPGNQDIHALVDRLVLSSYLPGVADHFTRPEQGHHWTRPLPRATGLYRDVFLSVTGKPHIDDVFITPSVRKMELSAKVSVKHVPAGVTLSAAVRDGKETVLDLGSIPVGSDQTTVTIAKPWPNPVFWEPSNPYLYHLHVELKDAAGNVLGKSFVRFGFREIWIEGTQFVFNGKKIYFHNASLSANALPMHRQHLRKYYQDLNQQGNINIVRWHIGGTLHPETAEVADEMGMFLQPENAFGLGYLAYISVFGGGEGVSFDYVTPIFKWHTDAIKRMRNSPSVVSWSSENEHLIQLTPQDVKTAKPIIDIVLKLNGAIREVDPTRPIVNNGGTALAFFDYWKDPRVDVIDGHYVSASFFGNWQKRFGKPCCTGEESLGGHFAWTYQGEVGSRIGAKADFAGYFYNAVNAAANFIGDRIKMWKAMKLSSICPFAFDKRFNPCLPPWKDATYGAPTPKVPWPAMSGENVKPVYYGYDYGPEINFYDPSIPLTYLRTWNAVRDNFDEVAKLQPRFSPEVIVELIGKDGKPMADQLVWLIPTDQPGTPMGLHTDENGKAWFWCKAGAGTYVASTQMGGQTYRAEVVPAAPGEWLQIKTVRCTIGSK
jgi:hypothetical protein